MTHELSDYFENGFLLDWYDGLTRFVARRVGGEAVSVKKVSEVGQWNMYVVQRCSEDLYSLYLRAYGPQPADLLQGIWPLPDDGIEIPFQDNDLFNVNQPAQLLILGDHDSEPLWEEISPGELTACIACQPGAVRRVVERLGRMGLVEMLAEKEAKEEAWRLKMQEESKKQDEDSPINSQRDG